MLKVKFMATKKRGRISKAFKREVAIEYLQGGGTMKELALKYNLPNIQSVSNWIRCYLTPEEVQNKRKTEGKRTLQRYKISERKSSVLGYIFHLFSIAKAFY